MSNVVEAALANDVSHHLTHSLVWPFFLAIFCECQFVAENLHATEMRFERHDQCRPIDLRQQRVLRVGNGDEIRQKVVALAIGSTV